MASFGTTLTGDAGLTGATSLALPSVSMNERQDGACVSGNPKQLDGFNFWIGLALRDLARLPGSDRPRIRRAWLCIVAWLVRDALSVANAMRCPARKAMCLRVLNWLNAEIRRLPA